MEAFLTPEILIPFMAIMVVVSFMYASVGHGGASGYLALMALFSFPMAVMKPTALLLNIFVAGVSFWFFRKNKHFDFKLFYPFAITSIPAAYLGGYIEIDATWYKRILAFFLVIAILRMLNVLGKQTISSKPASMLGSMVIGLFIGLFSGMIGIGGGIILSPVLILLGWANMKQAAAVSALFIFVNSIAGMLGFLSGGGELPVVSWYFVPVALIGGSLGALYGSQKLAGKTLSYLLSTVLMIAAVKLFLVK